MFIVLVALLYLLLTRAALAADYSGLVVSVLDGDTIEVLHNRHPERIRLSGIDCPEKGQQYGHQAKQATAEMVFGKEVLLQSHGLDKYGRTLGDVFSLGMAPTQSHAGQRWLVLVVSEECTGGYGA